MCILVLWVTLILIIVSRQLKEWSFQGKTTKQPDGLGSVNSWYRYLVVFVCVLCFLWVRVKRKDIKIHSITTMLQMSNMIHSTVSYKFIRLVFPGKGLQWNVYSIVVSKHLPCQHLMKSQFLVGNYVVFLVVSSIRKDSQRTVQSHWFSCFSCSEHTPVYVYPSHIKWWS